MKDSFVEEKLPDRVNMSVWIKIFPYLKKYWLFLIFIIASIAFTAFYDSSFIPLLNRAAFSYLQTAELPGVNIANMVFGVNFFGWKFSLNFFQYISLLLGAMVIRAFAILINHYFTNYLAVKIMTDIRRDAFIKLQELTFSYYDKTPSGWLIARLQNDTSKISRILSWGLIRTIWVTAELLFTLITMFSMSWKLSLVILSTAPIIIFLAPYFETRLLTLSRKARNAYSRYVAWLAECIIGAKTIKSLAIEDTTYQETSNITEDIRKKRFRSSRMHAIFQPAVNAVAVITTAVIVIFGPIVAPKLQDGEIEVALLIIFIGFISSIYNPIQEFADIFGEIMDTQASVEKVMSIINTKPEIVDHQEVVDKYGDFHYPKTENYEKMDGNIKFEHVAFSYIEGVEVLHPFTLDIKAGTSVAIVGETGSGKSTFVSLLLRFYEPSKGRILIDGKDYRDRSTGWLRSNTGFVSQNSFIFNGTIFDNIRYGKLDATLEEVITASKAVNLHQFVVKLPDAYMTKLSDAGQELSVGQKQLISFARAIIRNPRLMILDEATSSIDTETEALIQDAVNKALSGRTSIIIAHRLSTIVDSDRILVMKDGLIIEDGSHTELMNRNGSYHKLYMNQFRELQVDAQIEQYEKQVEKKEQIFD
ncbi:MAG TPA: ABC transporter ATP-binding protein [Bacilli bacterium]|nr:ABC transporter ATP-binding protein [Bacilli bacterium]